MTQRDLERLYSGICMNLWNPMGKVALTQRELCGPLLMSCGSLVCSSVTQNSGHRATGGINCLEDDSVVNPSESQQVLNADACSCDSCSQSCSAPKQVS